MRTPDREAGTLPATGVLLSSGVDVVAIDRVASLVDRFDGSFLDRAYADAEVAYCESRADPDQHYAARWAAKEAAIKALPDDGPTVTPSSVVVVASGGEPRLDLRGPARAASERLAARADVDADALSVGVSLSHDRSAGTAVAHVVVGVAPGGFP